MLVALTLATAALAAGPLDGIWRQDCSRGYSREEAFRGDQAAYSERNFWDGACSQPAVETISEGTVTLGPAVSAPGGAREIDFQFTTVSLRPVDVKAAAAWRERGVCGFRDWAAGVAKVVTGRECDFFGLGSVVRVPATGDRKFGVVKAGEGMLFFGRLSPARDGSSPEKRPLELDPAPYRKVP